MRSQAHPDHQGGSIEAFQAVQAAHAALQRAAHERQWGTSSSAYGAHVQPAKQAIEWNGAHAR